MLELFNKPHRPRAIAPLEIAKITSLSPFSLAINGVEYTTHDLPIYVPKKYLIRQKQIISANATQAYVDIYDLEIEPDTEQKPLSFNVGDTVLITDRGNLIVVIEALYSLPKGAGV